MRQTGTEQKCLKMTRRLERNAMEKDWNNWECLASQKEEKIKFLVTCHIKNAFYHSRVPDSV